MWLLFLLSRTVKEEKHSKKAKLEAEISVQYILLYLASRKEVRKKYGTKAEIFW